MNKIPSYALYGEQAQPVWHQSLHVEPISIRSGAYDWVIDAHRHDSLLQILYVQSGAGEVAFDSERLTVEAPCVILVPALVVHGFRWAGKVSGCVVTAEQHPLESITGILAPAQLPRLRQPQVIALPRWRQAEDPLRPLFRALQAEYHNREEEHVASSMALLLALVIAVFRLDVPAPLPLPRGGGRRAQQVKAFRELVDTHFRQHWPLKRYAEALGVTLVTLGRLCQEQLGMTPMTVINARLILEAKRQLAHSSLSVKEIAHDLGFADLGYFSRFFRKHTQLSPSAFKSALQLRVA
ncbi:helix-turn-helix domain-containing protein [Pseudomonas panipatensis]|uniref:AraC family transcriptional regulator, transcriptional activator of pobA n=1 Tax=Pseudomonas panipatensis TaxID=428992 RepID=A0A1G8GD63_9PSED|nr:helix-turn-helix domain-containing protein [Pseudomonas panipatensis]SDH92267.1 AraC family transcriptional regulator, transcriptional activator of pobA [Pseudomonas panipatensis]SMP44108.1 transcriptional regulator, AraC family [Pseudomonas panipatensis]